jgi:UDP-glucose 4-epimerase
MIQFVEQVSGRKIPYEIVDRRSGDLAEVVADVSLAREWLGWTAKRGVKEAVRMGWKFRR